MKRIDLIKALLTDVHETIDAYSEGCAEEIGTRNFSPMYPPGISVSQEHLDALASIGLSNVQREAVKIHLKDLCASVVFDLFSKMDGVTEPDSYAEDDVWLGLRLEKQQEDHVDGLLHDMFLEHLPMNRNNS